jgi:pilus assembly protein CpaB
MIRLLLIVIGVAAAAWGLWSALSERAEAPQTVASQSAPPAEETAAPVEAPAPDGPPRIAVLTASRDLAADVPLQAGDLVWTEMPEDAVAPGSVRQDLQPAALEESLGRTPTVPLVTGQPVVWSALQAPAPVVDLSQSVLPGKSAMAIRVSASTAAGGLIRPGDYVDVIYIPIPGNADPAETARFLATGVRVLAVDQSTGLPPITEPANISILTVELDRDHVVPVSAAAMTGQVTVALRARGDTAAQSLVAAEMPNTIRIIRQSGIELVEPAR